MFNRFFYLMLLSLVVLTTKGQDKKIVIESSLGKDIADRYINITTRKTGIANPYLIKEHRVKVLKDGLVKWSFKTDTPIVIFSKELFGDNNVYLSEPGDSIFIEQGKDLIFSGTGSEKYRVVYENYKVRKQFSLPKGELMRLDSLKDYFGFCLYVSRRFQQVDSIFQIYKSHISGFAYSYLRTDLMAGIEGNRLMKFLLVGINKNKLSLSTADLSRIYDTTVALSPVFKLLPDSNNLGLADNRGFIFEANRIASRREMNFKELAKESREEQEYLLCYKRAKYKYDGIVKESILAYTVYRLIKGVGFTNAVENTLADYYSSSEYVEIRNWVKEYEIGARKLVNNRNAPEFEIMDANSKLLSLADLKGKVVLMDFWFTGCKGCIQMAPVLEKVKTAFKNDSNVVFLSISTDTDRQKWLHSINTGKYTIKDGLHAYTLGVGNEHFIVRKYNVTSYPYLHLIDQTGKFAVNPVPDPRLDQGEALIKLIKDQIYQAADGPHVLYRDKKAVVRTVKINESGSVIDSIVFKDADNALEVNVNTDEYGKMFAVPLRKNLKNEPSIFPMPSKLLVLSDIEGNLRALRKLLVAGGVIDSEYNWSFANGHLVLLGDFFDRGKQVTECLWFIYSLEEKAEKEGGKVHFILGNHEIMNLNGQTTYMHDKYKDYQGIIGEKYKNLFGESSELGRWLRTKNIMEKIGDILFVHGGIGGDVNKMPYSISELNNMVRPYLDKEDTLQFLPDTSALKVLYDANTSPFWYREYYENADIKGNEIQRQIDSTFRKFDVSQVITGHTISADTISAHYEGKVINVDTKHIDGKSEALLIEGSRFYRIDASGHRNLFYRRENVMLTLGEPKGKWKGDD